MPDQMPEAVKDLLERRRAWHRARAATPLQEVRVLLELQRRICRSSPAGARTALGSGRGTGRRRAPPQEGAIACSTSPDGDGRRRHPGTAVTPGVTWKALAAVQATKPSATALP